MALVFEQMKARLYSVLKDPSSLEKEAQEFAQECIPDDVAFVSTWTGVLADVTGQASTRALFFRLVYDVFSGEDVHISLQRHVDIFHGVSPNQRMVNDLLDMEKAEQETPARAFVKEHSNLGILGGPPVPDALFLSYLDKHGREYTAQPLPPGIKKGAQKECYKNATQLSLAKTEEYTYVEGIALNSALPGMVFSHAWVVDKSGNVVDNTWANPEDCRYFGVPVTIERLYHWANETKVYGIFGGSDKASRQLITNGEAP